jgi:phospholipase/carboxylesterase
MQTKQIIAAGKRLAEAEKALILVHGRGADAQDILSLAEYLNVKDFALLAPQATNHSWYPYSFLAPQQHNEPWLSSALYILENLMNKVVASGISAENTYFLGFSQGACLVLEFTTRNAQRFGGVVAFSGGLIGQQLQLENYQTDFQQTPVFLGCSDVDPHIPLERVQESGSVLQQKNADLILKIYPNMGHTVNEDEIKTVNDRIFL